MTPLLFLRIKCGGADDNDVRCEEDILISIGTRKREGLTVSSLDKTLDDAGWLLTVGEIEMDALIDSEEGEGAGEKGEPDAAAADEDDIEVVSVADPLCPACAQAFIEEVGEEMGEEAGEE